LAGVFGATRASLYPIEANLWSHRKLRLERDLFGALVKLPFRNDRRVLALGSLAPVWLL